MPLGIGDLLYDVSSVFRLGIRDQWIFQANYIFHVMWMKSIFQWKEMFRCLFLSISGDGLFFFFSYGCPRIFKVWFHYFFIIVFSLLADFFVIYIFLLTCVCFCLASHLIPIKIDHINNRPWFCVDYSKQFMSSHLVNTWHNV